MSRLQIKPSSVPNVSLGIIDGNFPIFIYNSSISAVSLDNEIQSAIINVEKTIADSCTRNNLAPLNKYNEEITKSIEGHLDSIKSEGKPFCGLIVTERGIVKSGSFGQTASRLMKEQILRKEPEGQTFSVVREGKSKDIPFMERFTLSDGNKPEKKIEVANTAQTIGENSNRQAKKAWDVIKQSTKRNGFEPLKSEANIGNKILSSFKDIYQSNIQHFYTAQMGNEAMIVKSPSFDRCMQETRNGREK